MEVKTAITGHEPVSIADLTDWFRQKLGDERASVVNLTPLSGGLSNESYRVVVHSAEEQTRYVLRCDPGEGIMAPYDIALQFRVCAALAGSEVPVPHAFWLEQDAAVIGRDFCIFEFVPSETPPRLLDRDDPRTPARRASYQQTLAAIHRVDWRARGMNEFFADDANIALHLIEGQGRFLAKVESPEDVALFGRARDWLRERAEPCADLRLVHGDCSLSNYLFRDVDVAAVVDWELSCAGDPLMDVAFYCGLIFRYRADASPDEKARERDQFLAEYQALTDCSYDRLGFWEALSAFRTAVMSSQPEYAAHATNDYKDRLAALLV